jgi:hypothetical protein
MTAMKIAWGLAIAFAIALLGMICLPYPALATADGPACAVIKNTPDGFLNLRDKSSMNGKVIAKLEPGLYIVAWGSERGIDTKNGWVEVEGAWRSRDNAKKMSGWVARRFLHTFRCPDWIYPWMDS